MTNNLKIEHIRLKGHWENNELQIFLKKQVLTFFETKQSQRADDLPYEPFFKQALLNRKAKSNISTIKDDDVNEILVKVEMKKFQMLIKNRIAHKNALIL